jgi:hypothetical protein
MSRSLPLLTAIPLLVAVGYLEGQWTNRWFVSDDLTRAAERLPKVPLAFGEWEGKAQELDARTQELAGIDGYLLRSYVRRRTGDTVTAFLVCGRPGHIAAHTPDVCYNGAGYVQNAEAVRRSVSVDELPRPVDCLSAKFQKPAALPEPLHIIWTWTADGDWQAPDNPRLHFVRSPVLYKLYIVQSLGNPRDDADKTVDWEFLRTFLPEVRKALFPAS